MFKTLRIGVFDVMLETKFRQQDSLLDLSNRRALALNMRTWFKL